MRLTKSFGQYKSISSNVVESELFLCVDYDPASDTVLEVIHVWSYNHEKRVTTDLTSIFEEYFALSLDTIIEKVEWRELYSEAKAESKAA